MDDTSIQAIVDDLVEQLGQVVQNPDLQGKSVTRAMLREIVIGLALRGYEVVKLEDMRGLLQSQGFVILSPAEQELSASEIFDLESTLVMYNANKDVEQGDINAEAALQSLKQRGWKIIPPR